jgi:hypothetical protein
MIERRIEFWAMSFMTFGTGEFIKKLMRNLTRR